MKKLIALLAVLGFASSAYAADGADFSHSGEFRVQYTNDMNSDGNDDANPNTDQTFHQRLRWGTNVRAGEKLSGHFTLVHNADWGSNADQTPDDIGTTATDTNNVLVVNEAYATWMATEAWMIRFGRGSLTMADGRFVSANEWEHVWKAFDGVMASWDQDFARLSFFGVIGSTDTTEANDFGRFFGVSSDFKSLPSFLKTAHLHVVQVKRDEGTYEVNGTGAALAKQENLKAGVTLTGEAAALDWRVNYEMETGEENTAVGADTTKDIDTNMMEVELGYTVAQLMNSRFYVGYHQDSGSSASDTDDKTYDGFHYDKHYNAGLMDVLDWGNLTYIHAGVTMSPADDINVGLAYYMFSQTEEDGATTDNALGAASANAASEDELGSEINVWVTKKYTNNFSINARYGIFKPGDEYAADDQYDQIYVESKLTF